MSNEFNCLQYISDNRQIHPLVCSSVHHRSDFSIEFNFSQYNKYIQYNIHNIIQEIWVKKKIDSSTIYGGQWCSKVVGVLRNTEHLQILPGSNWEWVSVSGIESSFPTYSPVGLSTYYRPPPWIYTVIKSMENYTKHDFSNRVYIAKKTIIYMESKWSKKNN